MHIHSFQLLLEGAHTRFQLLCHKLFMSGEAMFRLEEILQVEAICCSNFGICRTQFIVRLIDVIVDGVVLSGQRPEIFALASKYGICPGG